jgi:hypothetical protein
MSHGVQTRAEYRNRIERDSAQKVTRFYKYEKNGWRDDDRAEYDRQN